MVTGGDSLNQLSNGFGGFLSEVMFVFGGSVHFRGGVQWHGGHDLHVVAANAGGLGAAVEAGIGGGEGAAQFHVDLPFAFLRVAGEYALVDGVGVDLRGFDVGRYLVGDGGLLAFKGRELVGFDRRNFCLAGSSAGYFCIRLRGSGEATTSQQKSKAQGVSGFFSSADWRGVRMIAQ